jgi:hypothetical protein
MKLRISGEFQSMSLAKRAGPSIPLGGVGLVDDFLWHRLHDDEVEVRQLVIPARTASSGRIVAGTWPWTCSPEAMGFARGRRDPFGLHRRVEFDAPQARVLDLADRRDRFRLAGDGHRALGCKRVLAIDDRRDEGLPDQQVARRPALGDRLCPVDHGAGAAEAGHSVRNVGEHVPVVADVHVAVPDARDESLAAASMTRVLGGGVIEPAATIALILPSRRTARVRTNTPLSASNSGHVEQHGRFSASCARKRVSDCLILGAVAASWRSRMVLALASKRHHRDPADVGEILVVSSSQRGPARTGFRAGRRA